MKEIIKQLSLMKNESEWAWNARQTAYSTINRLQEQGQTASIAQEPIVMTFDERDDIGYGVLNNLHSNDIILSQYGTETILEQMPVEWANKGVRLEDLFAALSVDDDIVKQYVNRVFPIETIDTAWQRLYMNSGVLLYIPDDVHVRDDIILQFIQDNSVDESLVKHVLLVVGKNAKVTIKEELFTFGEKKNIATLQIELIALTNASVHYASDGKMADALIKRGALLSAGARLTGLRFEHIVQSVD